MTDLRENIQSALADFQSLPLADAARRLFGVLGYVSQRTLDINAVGELQALLDPNALLTNDSALLDRWRSVHLLFQLTDSEIRQSSGGTLNLGLGDAYDPKDIRSYLFFAIDLEPRPDGRPINRADLSQITRTLNRLVPQPVLVLFRHGGSISLAIINRRRNLRDGTRDVLTRVSLIREIDCANPHRAHLGLLERFSLQILRAQSASFRTFADLDNAWQKLLSTQELKDSFYRELVDWFRWAITEIRLARLPDLTTDDAVHRARATQEFTVRLICRTLFTWFLKEMRLIPADLVELYTITDQRRVLTRRPYDPEANRYYRGILQNIFFQALNRPMSQRRKSGPAATNDRTVTDPELKKLAYLGKNNLPDDFNYDLFDRIPYLNGGLFDALPEDNASDTIEDGALRIPDKLFYATRADGFTVAAGTGRRAATRPVEGLNRIFDRYSFTVAENTPLEEDVALDPELLGLVFENLLAEIDPDDEAAAETARKASGSYYTPRRIVDYMVNEALHLHLKTQFEKSGASAADIQLLGRLCYELPDDENFTAIADRVVDVIESTRVLDPACGSGAFPMGMLHRMVELLGRVDPDNEKWKRRLIDRLPAEMREDARHGMEGKSYNYLRKLGVIQKNLYGSDIQPLAALIAKLRFFLTLVIEQDVNAADRTHNYGLQSLPNLETNLVCANTLRDAHHDMLATATIRELRAIREEYYQPRTNRERRDELARQVGEKLATLFPGFAQQTKGVVPSSAQQRYEQDAAWLSEWFKHATVAAPFFNVETFFPELVPVPSTTLAGEMGFMGEVGELMAPPPQNAAPFHIVIGNPPYGGTKIPDDVKDSLGLGSKDPYGAFIARFMGDPSRPSPLAEGGVLAYIVSDTFMTIKTHRPLREQMLRHRVHKMIRVSGDTFKATVNCAVILCQRGEAPAEQTCQMADLTNVSIWDQHERFLHLLYQTEGTGQMSRRQNVSNQTYALYHYRQNLIPSNSNIPFFVASPKLFALMNDTTAPVRHETISGKRVPVRTVTLNGNAVRLVKLGDIADVKVGLQTGDNDAYLFQNPDARGSYRSIEGYREFLLTSTDLERIRSDENLRNEVVQNGISKTDHRLPRYFGGRYIAPYDKGGESDSDEGWMPNYWVTTDYFIDWSEWAVTRMKTLTLREKLRLQGKTGGDDRLTSRFQNIEFYFVRGLTWSDAGIYSPTIRLSGDGVFDVKGSRFIVPSDAVDFTLGLVCSKLAKMWIKAIENHSISTQSDNIRELIVPAARNDRLGALASEIANRQRANPNYDYASNEQLEIDRLVYAAYGLNEADIREVEDWYARRYPKLAQAQRRALAAKQGRTEEQLLARPVLHLYCDESRHLPKDRETVMLMGALACPAESVAECHLGLKALCTAHGLPAHFEIKWTKVSPAKLDFYSAVLDWFLASDALSFRCLVLPDKTRTMQRLPDASRDHLYYGLYYQLLRQQLEPENRYRAFLDMKDTRGREKLAELTKLLRTDADEFSQLQQMQHVRSHEIGLLQITDFLLGAVGYARSIAPEPGSPAKLALIRHLEDKLGFPLTADSPPGSSKARIATWHDSDALLL